MKAREREIPMEIPDIDELIFEDISYESER